MRWGIVVFASVFLLTAFSVHAANATVSATNSTLVGQCDPADPVNTDYATWSVLALLIGAALLLAGKAKRSMLLAVLGVLCIIGGLTYAWNALELNSYTIHFGVPGSDHAHADFAVMVNNQLVNFTSERYMSYAGHELSVYAHLHTPDSVVHKHATGVTWQYFFKTLGMSMDDNCIMVNTTYICGATFIVNGTQISTLATEIHEGDRALFHYGQGNASAYFNLVVGNNSCLHSGTCLDRGFIPGCNP